MPLTNPSTNTAIREASIGVQSGWSLLTEGIHGGFPHAIVLEGVAQRVRSAMFFVPGALGIQEGGRVRCRWPFAGNPRRNGSRPCLNPAGTRTRILNPRPDRLAIIEGSRAWKNTPGGSIRLAYLPYC
jgi:hypothetical protein